MGQEFKQCPNGHFYQGAQCPYCRTHTQGDKTVFGGNAAQGDTPTERDGNNKTQIIDTIPGGPGYVGTEDKTVIAGMEGQRRGSVNKTVFGETSMDPESVASVAPGAGLGTGPRYERKLVGWLVSYTLNPLGVDYRIYEGRNIIGRDADCNITVADGSVSAKHAVLLYRVGKFSLTDQQSSHGTFVNGVDIELEPHYLQDGDAIKIGKTIFKFRSAL